MIKAIIFDFFGVIGLSTHSLIREQFELTESQIDELRNLHKLLDYEYIGSKKYLSAYAAVVGISYEEMLKIYNDSVERFAHSKILLDYIKELRKTYKISLLSNVSKEAYIQFIEPIKEYFDVIVTSHETQLAKPEQAIYEYCADQLGVDTSECVMIDDSKINCEGAISAGMQATQYEDFDQFKKDLIDLLKN